jgi:diacylglycerol kinase family enzyme
MTSGRVIISINPKAGRKEARPKAERLAELLRDQGLHSEVLSDLGAVSEQAMRWQAEDELRAVVAAGGDGTVTELVNRTPPGTPIATLPLGTENLLAKYLGQQREPEAVCETVVRGVKVELDAGCATAHNSSGQPHRRLFLLMATAGLDADVIYRLEQTRQGHISHWSYAKPIWQALRNYKYPPLRATCWTDPAAPAADPLVARWVFLFNLPCYARGLAFTPRASGDDGLFDLCTFERGSFAQGLKYLAAVLSGRHDRLRECTLRQVTRLRIEADEPVLYQLDGDFGGHLPVEIEMLRKRLTLVVPEEWAGRKGIRD